MRRGGAGGGVADGRGGAGGAAEGAVSAVPRRLQVQKGAPLAPPLSACTRRGRRASHRGRRRSPANDSMAGGLLGSGAALAMWGLSQLRSTRGPRPNQPRPAPPRAAGARRTDAAGPTGCPAQRAVIPRIAHTSPARPQHRGPAPATPYPPHPPPTHPPKASLKPRPTP